MGGVIDFITDVIDTVVDIVVDVVETVVDIVEDVVDFITDPFGSLMPDMPSGSPSGPANNAAQGVKLTKRGASLQIPIVYGFRRVGGNVVFAETNGTDNKDLYVVYVFAEGEVQGIKQILIDGDQAHNFTDTSTDALEVSISSGRYFDGTNSLVTFQLFHGSDGQSQSTLANGSATWGDKQRKLPGLCYGVFKFTWYEKTSNNDPFQSPWKGGIPNVQIDVLGKKVYDCTTISTGAEDLSAAYASLTKTFESGVGYNPINCLLDYMLNPRYGAGMGITQINAEAFRVAAVKCAQVVTYTSDSTAGPAMTMNGVIPTNNQIFDNIKQLLQGSRSMMPYIQGRYKVKVEDGGNATDITSSTVTVTQDLDDDNIIGGIALSSERKSTKFNKVIVNFVHPDMDFTNQQVIEDKTSTYATEDASETLTGEFNFPTLTNEAIAKDLARIIVLKSRTARTIKFRATQESMELEPGDIIRITQTVPNLSLKTFRVTGIEINNNMTVTIQGAEHNSSLYPYVTQDQVEIPPPLYLPSQYVFTPTPNVVAQTPITTSPPNSTTTVNNTLPTQTVNTTPLYSVTTFGQTTNGSNTNYHGAFTTSSVLGINTGGAGTWAETYPIIDGDASYYTIKFTWATPLGTITKVQAQLYDKDSKALYQTQTYDTRTTSSSNMGVGYMSITEGTRVYIKIRYLDINGQEYTDGGSATAEGSSPKLVGASSSYNSGLAYVDLDGNSGTKWTIEAEINRLLADFEASGSKTIRQTLGISGVSSTGATTGASSVTSSLI